MKVLILISLFCSLMASAYSQCDSVHEGEFYVILDDSSRLDISRSGEFQIETHEKSGTVIKNKIEWVNDCTYSLQLVTANDEYLKSQKDNEKLYDPLIVKIISIGDGFYYQATYRDKETKPVAHGKVMFAND